jgi:hypothetical protein
LTPGKAVSRLLEFGPPVIAGYARHPARCIFATAVAIDVLKAFDVDAGPFPVRVTLANRRYLEAKARGADDAVAIACGGHLMVQASVSSRGEWAGHLVAHLPAQRVLLDLDLRQFNRPQHGIHVPASSVFPWPPGTRAQKYRARDGESLIHIERLDDETFRASGDWLVRARREPIVAAIARAIRANKLSRGEALDLIREMPTVRG